MNQRPSDWDQEFESGFAGRLIRQKVNQLRRQLNLNTQDAEDLEQNFRLEVWRRSGKYDSRRGNWMQFASLVIDRLTASEYQKLSSRTLPASLDDRNEGRVWAQQITPRDYLRRLEISNRSQFPDLNLDVKHLSDQLDYDQIVLTEMLKIWNVSEVARITDTPRSTVDDHAHKLRKPFRKINPKNF